MDIQRVTITLSLLASSNKSNLNSLHGVPCWSSNRIRRDLLRGRMLSRSVSPLIVTNASMLPLKRDAKYDRHKSWSLLPAMIAMAAAHCLFLCPVTPASIVEPSVDQEKCANGSCLHHEIGLNNNHEGGNPNIGLKNGRIQGCVDQLPCVSTSAFQSPSRYLPPWTFLGDSKEAQQQLELTLIRSGATVHESNTEGYVYATIPRGLDNVDDLEFLFIRDNIVCFRSVSRKFIPDPPFCWWKGCINGPQNRTQLESLRDDLGWVPLETDEDKKWVPLLFH